MCIWLNFTFHPDEHIGKDIRLIFVGVTHFFVIKYILILLSLFSRAIALSWLFLGIYTLGIIKVLFSILAMIWKGQGANLKKSIFRRITNFEKWQTNKSLATCYLISIQCYIYIYIFKHWIYISLNKIKHSYFQSKT